MAKVEIMIVSREEWKRIIEKFGDGQVPVLGAYDDLDHDAWAGHYIARGHHDDGTLVNTGHMMLGNDSKGTVSGLPN